jgi:hypothetical protein
VARLARNPGVGAVFYYELLDEPYMADGADYGLVRVARGAGNRWVVAQRKGAFEALRAAMAGAPQVPGAPAPTGR